MTEKEQSVTAILIGGPAAGEWRRFTTVGGYPTRELIVPIMADCGDHFDKAIYRSLGRPEFAQKPLRGWATVYEYSHTKKGCPDEQDEKEQNDGTQY